MAVTLVPTAGAANANTYAEVADADAWADADANGAAWLLLTADEKAAMAARTARALDDAMAWAGEQTDDVQALQWPRQLVVRPNGFAYAVDEIPRAVKDAHVELMVWAAAQGVTSDPFAPADGLVKIGVGPISLDYGSRAPTPAGVAFIEERLAPKLRAAGCLGNVSSRQFRLTR